MKKYIAPQLTVVEFKIERGYTVSFHPEEIDKMLLIGMEPSEVPGGEDVERPLEYYIERSDWGSVSEGNHFFE
jgi:hypothetical protein